jgi:hypothetical protein
VACPRPGNPLIYASRTSAQCAHRTHMAKPAPEDITDHMHAPCDFSFRPLWRVVVIVDTGVPEIFSTLSSEEPLSNAHQRCC